jgi:hypothetical protein
MVLFEYVLRLLLTISCSPGVDFVQCCEVVQPVQRRAWTFVIASYQQIAVIWRLRAPSTAAGRKAQPVQIHLTKGL